MTNSVSADIGKRGQFRLRTLLLIIAAVASWLAWHQAASDVRDIKRELPGLRRATRELIVTDPTQFAVVEKSQIWSGEFRWEVHVPEGRNGHLHLALQDVTAKGFAKPCCSLPVQSGVNVIEYRKHKTDEGWHFSLHSGPNTADANVSREWMKRSVTTVYGTRFTESQQLPADKPLDLVRSRAREGSLNTEEDQRAYDIDEVDGELIWIELE